MSKIENRNLIVTETFDEFALATEDIDFSVEDLVAYVTSLANVFYWLNVESVWGRLGFVWDHIENNQGYGHFVHTTIPFSVIPSLPDGERITAIKSAFLSSVSAQNVIILKSNWENLEHISSIAKNSVIDLTGAPLTEMFTNTKYDKWIGNVRTYFWNSYKLVNDSNSLYLKADFSACGAENPAYFGIGGTLIVDDENKYLNMPSHMYDTITDHSAELAYSYQGTIEWKGEGPFKLDYVWRDVDANSDIIASFDVTVNNNDNKIFYEYTWLRSDASNYLIDSESGEYIIPTYVKATQNPDVFEGCKSFIAKFKSGGIKVIVDCTFSSIVFLRSIIGSNPRGYEYCSSYHTTGIVYNNNSSWQPLSFIGNVSQIDLYNPYMFVENGVWPEFNADLASKVMDNDLSALIYNPRFYGNIGKCPYTFNVTNRRYVNMTFCDVSDNYSTSNMWTVLPVEYLNENTDPVHYSTPSPAYSTENWNTAVYYVYDIMPTLTGMHRFEMLKIALPHGPVNNSAKTYVVAKIPSVEANLLKLMGAFILENTKIKATVAEIYGIYFEKSDAKNIYLYTTAEHDSYSLTMSSVFWYIKTDIDFIELESYDDSIINRSKLNLSPSDSYFKPARGYAYKQPFILTSSSLTVNKIPNYDVDRYFNPSYMFVKSGVNIEITYPNQSSTLWSVENIKRIIHSIKKIDGNTAVGTITLKDWLYDALVADDANFENYVINTLGYTLIKRL